MLRYASGENSRRPLISVAIVGGGFSGTVVAANLLRTSEHPILVSLFDRSGTFGAGLAYGTDSPHHYLNVPAGKMSAFSAEPNHFCDWLQVHGLEKAFLPRRTYREYLEDVLLNAACQPRNPASKLEKVGEEVIEVHRQRVHTPSRHFAADHMVLATGYLPETGLLGIGVAPFRPEDWPESGVNEVVIAGAGLSALDAAVTAFDSYSNARVTCVSRHGFLPEPFELGAAKAPLTIDFPSPKGRAILKRIRAEAKTDGWQAVFDALRPRWDAIWADLSEFEQRRFLRHLRRWFERFRHRIPPETVAIVHTHASNGTFRHLKGKLCLREGTVFLLEDSGNPRPLRADLVVDCSGASFDWGKSREPLFQSLFATGRLTCGPHRMGIATDEDGRIEGNLWALGPLLKGQRWETTAVPEIRVQAERLAQAIIESV